MKEIAINPLTAGLVLALLNALGACLKRIPRFENHYIPFALGLVGALAYAALEGWTGANVVVGLAVALGAVGAHQTFQQGAAAAQKSGPLLVCLAPGLTSALLLGFVVGCASSSTITGPDRVQRSVDAAVGIFATVKLQEHPQSRPQFEAARRGLDVLVSSERWDLAAFGESLASTGASQISGADIVLIVETTVTLIDAITGQDVDLSRVEYARAVIVGGQRALTRVLARPAS